MSTAYEDVSVGDVLLVRPKTQPQLQRVLFLVTTMFDVVDGAQLDRQAKVLRMTTQLLCT